jgi:multidrug resistance efflux pump
MTEHSRRPEPPTNLPLKSAEARLPFLRLKHARVEALQKKSISSLEALQEAEAEVHVAEWQLKEAKLAMEIARLEVQHAEEIVKQRTLCSPINGVVIERLLYPGEYRAEQTPILTLAEIDQLRVEVFLPIAHYYEVHVGGRAEVRPEPPVGGSTPRQSPWSTVCSMPLAARSACAWPWPTLGSCCWPEFDARF